MFSGWTAEFKTDRPLSSDERMSSLPIKGDTHSDPFPYSSIIRFNSTFVDFIDRRFRLRGMVVTSFGALLLAGIVALGLFLIPYVYLKLDDGDQLRSNLIFYAAIAAMCFGIPIVIWRKHYRKELFTYSYYPIRFNRKTRKVHVFRHNGPDGVLTVPFDEVFWHVGRGLQKTFLCDARGHVMDGNTVKDTFAVGNYFDDSQMDRIHSIWTIIRRYMGEGPEAVAEHPLDRTIDLSTKPTWTNCYLWVVASLGQGARSLRFALFPIIYPIYGILTLGRWLTLNSCEAPEWPAYIEAESRIDAHDPHQWEEPEFLWEFANREGVAEREIERQRKQSIS